MGQDAACIAKQAKGGPGFVLQKRAVKETQPHVSQNSLNLLLSPF